MITLDELRSAVSHTGENAIDTVLLGIVDMQGRLQGKRFDARHFVDTVAEEGAEGCNYLLAVDVDMNTVDGYAMSSWDTGYGDFAMVPDLDTLRLMPWHPGSALVLADLTWFDGTPVTASPRQILRRQLDRLAERRLRALAGTELEFILYRDSYEDAFAKGYRELTPANQYNVDYSLLGTARVEPLLRRIRREMAAAGLRPESAKGECNLGQHEIAFRYTDALTTCDNHSIYKTGAKEIADQAGMALTFIAKYDEREGNSCHIHISLRGEDGPVSAGDGEHGFSPLFARFVAGQQACLRELTYLFAPNINSYKRY
ncbi:MAG TPA: glutamine synthetase, partial [Mycobacteriales bacterium]|nr:glutamine synthetase [Mycobacteriales bacterium]